ncbi:hypothetical protein [Hydrogenobacter thermophilus]|jgi:hypothetical protein|uniref:hypothetical protein n=1 Tax=Hydrogenobacter thermophilus TaxID=940 RepID=UPI0030F5280A
MKYELTVATDYGVFQVRLRKSQLDGLKTNISKITDVILKELDRMSKEDATFMKKTVNMSSRKLVEIRK